MIPTPLASRPSGSTASSGTSLVLALLCLEVPEPIFVHSRRPSAEDSIDSRYWEYEDYNGQSVETELDEVDEEEKVKVKVKVKEELEQGEDENLSSGWGAQRSNWYGFRESHSSILTVTPRQTRSSGRGIDYRRWEAPVLVHVSQNSFTPAIHSRLPTVLCPLETPAITPSQSGSTTPELDSVGEQHTSSRQNMATGLKRSIVLKARDLMWEWTIFVNLFPDAITLTEAGHRELGFANWADATPASNDQLSYP